MGDYHMKKILSVLISLMLVADPQLAMCVFDWACHSGPNNKSLKKALKNCNGDVNKFIKARRDFIERLIANDPTQEDFRNGWNNRLKDLAAYVKTLPDNYA